MVLAIWTFCGVGIFNHSALATDVPGGFIDQAVGTALSNATAMEIAPDGRIFVCEQAGRLRIIDVVGNVVPDPFLTLTVDSTSERGLLGVALDPNFTANRLLYVYYTTTSTRNRISRFRASLANPNVVEPGSETVLLEFPSPAGNHNGGALHFGKDGMLYVAVGDGAQGSNAQSLSNLHGKILRINPAGFPNIIPNDNPFVTTSGARGEIWAYGLRNPFTFAFDPVSGNMQINDVGQSSIEEINRGRKGANYGWPTCEGACSTAGFDNPVYSYDHSIGCAITGGAFYRGPGFTAEYDGNYFFADYCGGWIKRQRADGTVVDFASNGGAIIDIRSGLDGPLYYLTRSGVRRIVKTSSGSQPPVARFTFATTNMPAPLSVTVDATSSTDPDGGLLTYMWLFGDNTMAEFGPIKTHTYSKSGTYNVRLLVTDSQGLYSQISRDVQVGDFPNVTITSPSDSFYYTGGASVNYSAEATYPNGTVLPASAFSWTIVFKHDFHEHPFLGPINGTKSGSFTVPVRGETAATVFYQIQLTVTDANGLTRTFTKDVQPKTSTFVVNSEPAGLEVRVDGQPATGPQTIRGVAGIIREIGVISPQVLNGVTYEFKSWSDGGAMTHEISTPETSKAFTAIFAVKPVSTATPAPTLTATSTASPTATGTTAPSPTTAITATPTGTPTRTPSGSPTKVATGVPTPAGTATIIPTPTPFETRINCGSERRGVDSYRRIWSADTGFEGGEAVRVRARRVKNSVVPLVFRTERVNPLSYSLKVPNKRYMVVLRFAENGSDVQAAGDRVFTVSVENSATTSIDVLALAGGKGIGIAKKFDVTVTDGTLDITFTPVNGTPFINAIEVTERLGNPEIGTLSTKAVGATLFSERNFKGESFQLEAGECCSGASKFGKIGDNNVSSLVVEPGYRVKLCDTEDTSGKCAVFKPGRYRTINRTLNDKVSYSLVEELAALD